MSRHVKAYVRRQFGMIVAETPFNAGWVYAIKEIIPQSARQYNKISGLWTFDPRYFNAVKTITEHFHGSIIDSTGGVNEIQVIGWKEKWEAYKELDRKSHDGGYQEQRKKRYEEANQSIRNTKAASSAFATLFVAENAPPEVIQAAVRVLRVKFHPDAGGDNEVMARINAAYDELKKKGRV